MNLFSKEVVKEVKWVTIEAEKFIKHNLALLKLLFFKDRKFLKSNKKIKK